MSMSHEDVKKLRPATAGGRRAPDLQAKQGGRYLFPLRQRSDGTDQVVDTRGIAAGVTQPTLDLLRPQKDVPPSVWWADQVVCINERLTGG